MVVDRYCFMRVSLKWLKDYVGVEMSPAELGHLLTMSGLEVEALEALGQSLGGIIAAKILSVSSHPKADRLYLCHLDTGDREVQVVCSATNLFEGALVPLALPGTVLPGGRTVEESRIRGEISVGMLLAEDEMELSDDHSGIMILPSDLNPGIEISAALSLEDWALEVAVAPNRPDCASVIGIAREIAALTGQTLKRPDIVVQEEDTPIEDLAKVTLLDTKGCPRYAAGLIRGVELKPSPYWMRYRLFVSGVRSINNVVDISNYVLLEMGQPLHTFDYDRLKGNQIVVRRAEEGENFTTLDGQTRTLSKEILMICDVDRAVALAGIMGGLNSEIFAGSKNVLVESAYFDPIVIRRGAKDLGLSTEASYRFERGVDVDGVIKALNRALMLISKLAGGHIARGVIDNYPEPIHRPAINLRVDKTNQFLGTSIARETMAGYLKALEMDVADGVVDNQIQVRPPSFRIDITREIDLLEEVARMEGYDNIPVTFPPMRLSDRRDDPEPALGRRARETMIGFGFTEIISYSFISPDFADLFGAEKDNRLRAFIELRNPLSVDQSVMRTSLLPGLLSAVKTNMFHGMETLKLFEYGKVFFRRDTEELPQEELFLAAIMAGLSHAPSWYQKVRKVDFFDMKGVAEGLLKGLGIREHQLQEHKDIPGFHSERSAEIIVSGATVGSIGGMSPAVLEGYDLRVENVYVFQLDLGAVSGMIQNGRTAFSPFARFPAVFRDISVIVKREVESAMIRGIIEREGGDLVESVNVYDFYEGKNMDPSEKALTFRVSYRSKEGTLDGKEVNTLHEHIIDKIGQEAGGRLREG
jgi:phenylalanyl-tRNA synthetase beta chain